jgi:hypothetical protein
LGDVDDCDVEVRRGSPRFLRLADKSESDDEEKLRRRSFDSGFVFVVLDFDADDDNPCGGLDRDCVFDDADRGAFFLLLFSDDANNSGYFSGLFRSDSWILAPLC